MYASCLAVTNSLPNSTVVDSLAYVKQWLPFLITNSNTGPSFFFLFSPSLFHLYSLQLTCSSLVAFFTYKMSSVTLYSAFFSPTSSLTDSKAFSFPPLSTDSGRHHSCHVHGSIKFPSVIYTQFYFFLLRSHTPTTYVQQLHYIHIS